MVVRKAKTKIAIKRPSKKLISIQAERYRKKEAEIKLLAIVSGIGSRRQVHEFDLEKIATGFNGQVHMLDSVVLKTRNSVFEIVFLGINKERKLDCLLFVDRILRGQPALDKGEKVKIWSGMLADMVPFHVSITRLPVHIEGNGQIANVSLRVQLQEKIFF